MLMGLMADLNATLGANLGIAIEDIAEKDADEQIQYILDRAKQADLLPPGIGTQRLTSMWHTYATNYQVSNGYVPQDYPGKCVLIKAREKTMGKDMDLENTWRSVCKGEFHSHFSAGSHVNLVNQPHVVELAGLLNEYLSE